MRVGPFQAIKTCLAKSFQFSGRASQAEFWWFVGLVLLGGLVIAFVDDRLIGHRNSAFAEHHLLIWLYIFVVLLPLHAVAARRLKDANWPRWFAIAPLAITVICVAGMIAQLGILPYYDLKGLGWFLAWLALTYPFSMALIIGLSLRSSPFSTLSGPNPHEVPQ